jgi:hypothetical protein
LAPLLNNPYSWIIFSTESLRLREDGFRNGRNEGFFIIAEGLAIILEDFLRGDYF